MLSRRTVRRSRWTPAPLPEIPNRTSISGTLLVENDRPGDAVAYLQQAAGIAARRLAGSPRAR